MINVLRMSGFETVHMRKSWKKCMKLKLQSQSHIYTFHQYYASTCYLELFVSLVRYMERLLKKSEVVKFEESLMPHQKATLGNGLSVLQQAMLEHNVLATSKVYNNIRLSELGVLLEIDADEAEKVAAQMISEGRLEGSIDQVEQILEFNAGKF